MLHRVISLSSLFVTIVVVSVGFAAPPKHAAKPIATSKPTLLRLKFNPKEPALLQASLHLTITPEQGLAADSDTIELVGETMLLLTASEPKDERWDITAKTDNLAMRLNGNTLTTTVNEITVPVDSRGLTGPPTKPMEGSGIVGPFGLFANPATLCLFTTPFPIAPVKVGDIWMQGLQLPGYPLKGMFRCKYVADESVGLAKTARVRCSSVMPMLFYVDEKGNVVEKEKAVVELKGTGNLQNDINLEISTGNILRSSTAGLFKVLVTTLKSDDHKAVAMKLHISFGFNRLEQ